MTSIITDLNTGRRYYWGSDDEKHYLDEESTVRTGGERDACPVDGLDTYHTEWWCSFLQKYPGFGKPVEEFELLLDSFVASELDHIEDPDYDEVDRNTIGLVQRDAESRRNGFKEALLGLVVVQCAER